MRKKLIGLGISTLLLLTACGISVEAQSSTSTPEYGRSGIQVYFSQCVECHGISANVGPRLIDIQNNTGMRVSNMPAEDYVRQSIVDPAAYIVEGYNDEMPHGYVEQYSKSELDNLVRYILDYPGFRPTQIPANTVTVHGTLTQGTLGGEPIPSGLELTLHLVNADRTYTEDVATTTSNVDGSYVFENIPLVVGGMYLVEIHYQDVVQGGHSDQITSDVFDVDIPLTLYKRTDDPSSMMITCVQFLVSYERLDELGLEVRIDMVVVNTGDRIYTSNVLAENGLPVSLEIELPQGAFQVQTNWNEFDLRMKNEMIPVLQDTWPLGPSRQRTITLFYYLPFARDVNLTHRFTYPMMGAYVLLPNQIQIESDQFSQEGEFSYRLTTGETEISAVPLDPSESINLAKDKSLLKEYDLIDPVNANAPIEFSLEGDPWFKLKPAFTQDE